jgi:hypothetical protein
MTGITAGKRAQAAISAGLLLLVLSCAGPYYERAAITDGYSGGVGIGITAGERVTQEYRDMDAPTVVVRDVSGLGTAYVRYGWSNSAAFFMQATAGRGAWDHRNVIQGAEDLNGQLTDVQLGAKFRAGSNGAVKVGIGYPGLLDVAYLHDFGAPLTAVVGVGLRGLSLGITHHLSISPTILQHTSLTVTAFPFDDVETKRHWVAGAFLGLGWEMIAPQEEGEGSLFPDF